MPRFSIKRAQLPVRCAALWLFLLAATAFADNSKISPDLLPLLGNPNNSINVIVQYQPQSGGLLGGLIGGLTNLLSSLLNTVFTLLNAGTATLLPSDIINLSNQSNVTYITLDRPVGGMLDYTAAAVNAQSDWNMGLNGTGVGIAIIDSGVYAHPDLNAANAT